VAAAFALLYTPVVQASVNMALDEPIYGMADSPQETATASTGPMTDGTSIYSNITEKFPLLPNQFK